MNGAEVSEPIFLLQRCEDDVYEPIYIPPTLKDGCERLENLHNPNSGKAKVRLPQDGIVRVMNVLVSRYCGDMYITATEWRRELIRQIRKIDAEKVFGGK